ncbi:MAG: MmcQ/YjbR family DNA-binding protein [Streptococcus sp.]|nr:MmcQ/YjbR family DNA-binding protein [Streptococcus sp.]
MKWKLTRDLTELEGKVFPSQMEEFCFQVVTASKKQGLEIVALDEVNERYTLFDIPTTSSSIAQALREEAEELVFQWMHPEQSDIEETRQKWTKWIIENIVPYCGNPFEKTEALGFMVEEKGKWYGLMMQVPLQKLGVASKADALILNVKIHPEDKEQLVATDGIFEAYHMNKKHWISIALNVCTDDALIKECIYTSYKCVAKKDNSLLSTRDSL